MKGKLIKRNDSYWLYNENGETIASSWGVVKGKKLSLKNCQAIERGYDLEDLATNAADNYDSSGNWHVAYELFKEGFQKAVEILGDKKFSEEDVRIAIGLSRKTFLIQDEIIQSLQQTEWDVEIVQEPAKSIVGKGETNYFISKLDTDGCLILKRIDDE